MTGSLTVAFRKERGQTLVLFVVLLTGLVVLLAFVVDVGAWLGTKHKLQSVADAAALAAIQSGPVGPAIDDGWASLAYDHAPGTAPLDSFTVTATRAAPIILGGLAGIPGFTEKVTATAKAVPVSSLDNSDLTRIVSPDSSTPPYIAPLVVNECVLELSCPSGSTSACFGPPGCDLNFDATDTNTAGSSLFGLADIACAGCASSSAPRSRFRRWVTCGSCYVGAIQTGTVFPILTRGVSNNPARAAMTNLATTVPPTNLVLPVFRSNSVFTIVGFSRFVLTNVGPWTSQGANGCTTRCKVITGYFTNYTLPASFSNNAGAGLTDFGIRAIGLTN